MTMIKEIDNTREDAVLGVAADLEANPSLDTRNDSLFESPSSNDHI